jgi:hypothetical protein
MALTLLLSRGEVWQDLLGFLNAVAFFQTGSRMSCAGLWLSPGGPVDWG